MNNELMAAFKALRVSERSAVLQDLGYNMHPAVHETGNEFAVRVLRQISCDGAIRELENSMRRFQ
ncbi:hypothetical protein vB_PsyM_KIL3b_0093 [Pseudomonas phage vB_PsyM_KIL3b]|uniref:Uncharacterized protein n=3 Tax=Pseudomonas phage vB_PsyM_KIL1 TaxID=1777065 RepID=A0A142IG03_9CAUD|nr:hypothetical protein BH774_gp110 [Pseudomonas phage vB_PsyM_KIL1]AMR57339.1 hypothetical protein vB_PsyM_KIL1_0092 [Pseudomonas phage vB_PsyM_KIL1]AMR57660.1 hypothetical protein vB_PsyM_KIL3_0093 [Pseudomonas phage vB_PsyM_KIL3]AMR58158.1 hypothetical protein vB_PsyM_KIL3b_0093 [Pseudomonas phage vB_PsyM_KIL3b]